MTPLLELDDVHARYGHTRALHGVSLQLEEGSSLALLGANGAGKTTTLRAISGLVRKTGHISFAGRSIARKSPEAVARLGVAHVPQGRGIIGDLSVEDNLRLGAYTRRDRAAVRADTAKCSSSSRDSASACHSPPARSPAASSRCSRSAARCSSARGC